MGNPSKICKIQQAEQSIEQTMYTQLVLMHNARQSETSYHNKEDTHDTMLDTGKRRPKTEAPRVSPVSFLRGKRQSAIGELFIHLGWRQDG